tara:strand:+ start:7 stop:639 length:633 start_codon:yes stop_codon:yes gene_type:complete
MNELQELIVRLIRMAHEATEPQSWWEMLKGVFDGSASVWAAIAAAIAFASTLLNWGSSREATRQARLLFLDEKRRLREDRFSSIVFEVANWGMRNRSAKKVSDLEPKEWSEHFTNFHWRLRLWRDAVADGLPMHPDSNTWDLLECSHAADIRDHGAISAFPEPLRSSILNAAEIFDSWVEQQNARGEPSSGDDIPLFTIATHTPTSPPPK